MESDLGKYFWKVKSNLRKSLSKMKKSFWQIKQLAKNTFLAIVHVKTMGRE